MSKLITVDANGVPTAADAKLMDVVTSVVSTNTALTGTYGLIQKVSLVALGMSAQSKRKLGTWNPI